METSGLRQTLRALRHRNYRLFFAGQGISLIGTWMQRIALNWLVYDLTHSATMLGVIGFAGQIPTFLLGPLAGVLSDRWNLHRGRRDTLFVVAGAIGAVCGGMLRGPFYGLVPGAVLGLIVALAAYLLTRFTWTARLFTRRAWVIPSFMWILAATASLAVLWPAGARTTFRRWVTEKDVKFQAPLVFHRWGRDPRFALRFITDERGLETIVEDIHAIEERPPRPVDGDLYSYTRWSSDPSRTVDYYFNNVARPADLEDQASAHGLWLIEQQLVDVPDWWKVAEIRAPRTWHRKAGGGRPLIRIRYDPDTGLLYLEIVFM